jgi:hypothetical protein
MAQMVTKTFRPLPETCVRPLLATPRKRAWPLRNLPVHTERVTARQPPFLRHSAIF